MSISIKDPETDARIRELASMTGESITTAVRVAIEQRLQRESGRRRAGVATGLLALSLTNATRLTPASADAVIDYDDIGAPR
ncbi:MAG: type II toxin-antitoxin system VapB family antitoxin [Xanthomonadales bacterium]|nr:type II toxin-antitoxin system VapB family antitoxin [Xanthomonadales bacterium]